MQTLRFSFATNLRNIYDKVLINGPYNFEKTAYYNYTQTRYIIVLKTL